MVGKGSPKNVMAKGCRFLSSAHKKKPSPKFSGSRSADSPKGMFVHAFLSFFIDAMEFLLLMVVYCLCSETKSRLEFNLGEVIGRNSARV
jgi:hypothetical protein